MSLTGNTGCPFCLPNRYQQLRLLHSPPRRQRHGSEKCDRSDIDLDATPDQLHPSFWRDYRFRPPPARANGFPHRLSPNRVHRCPDVQVVHPDLHHIAFDAHLGALHPPRERPLQLHYITTGFQDFRPAFACCCRSTRPEIRVESSCLKSGRSPTTSFKPRLSTQILHPEISVASRTFGSPNSSCQIHSAAGLWQRWWSVMSV